MSTKKQGHRHPSQAGNAELREGSAEKPAPAGQKVSTEERSQLIRVRAYGLWEQAGKPDGDAARERFWREAEFWYEAEPEIVAARASDEGGAA